MIPVTGTERARAKQVFGSSVCAFTVHPVRGSSVVLSSRSRLVAAVIVAVLSGALFYLAATVGVQMLRSSEPEVGAGAGSLPQLVYKAPETVPATAAYGAPGSISVVFAGTGVKTGLLSSMENPWIAISGANGEYRALSVPHPPSPGPDAMRVSPAGSAVAWAFTDGVVVYDTVEDEARELTDGLDGETVVGRFSPDGRHLLVHDGTLKVLDVDTGDVAATVDGVPQGVIDQAVWTPDGAALTYVDGETLVRREWNSGARTGRPAPIAPGAALAWSPDGGRLAAVRERRGVKVVDIFEVSGEGALRPSRTVEKEGYAIQDLLGFSGDNSVAVTALRLETGPLTVVYSMSTVDDRQPMELTQLPGPGVNWVGAETAAFAGDALVASSVAFDEPRWPWSDLAKLVASGVVAVFVVGLYFTRPASRRRRRG